MPRPCRALVVFVALTSAVSAADVPRPEHPTPDAVRPHWLNLNGPWQFRFDPKDEGKAGHWEAPGAQGFDATITVPFPWESELSGVKQPDTHGVAWYRREFAVPDEFPKKDRAWLHFGAVDWEADVWVNGKAVAHHEGGYTPFKADVTEALATEPGKPAVVVVRVFDPTDPDLPTGKQVGWYTTTSGIWQTVWLESRPKARVEGWYVRTEIDPATARFDLSLAGVSAGKYGVTVRPDDPGVKPVETAVEVTGGATTAGASLVLPVPSPKLWTPETPNLYPVTIELKAPDGAVDSVKTYFGLRTIARGKVGDEPYEHILLNGKPVYLRTALDQSFNPKGIYTAPSDEFLKHDLEIAKANGLNGLRIHIKPDEPRRLYWADVLGLLILEDMPNNWRQNPKARASWEATMREVVARDRNHPAIVTWVTFNETWGLVTGSAELYKKDVDTQKWVDEIVSVIRSLDPTRLVEDHSPCNYDHIANTDLNSWHFYIDDHAEAKRHIDDVVAKTVPGSTFNYCPGQAQGTAPLINSEYGGVSAGSGDRDISWCFRDLTTLLRHQPKIQGYVYTELTDIEWEHNGFANYDRTPKTFGYGAFVPGMTPKDLNGADFVGYGGPPARVVAPGDSVSVPVFVSHFSDKKGPFKLQWSVSGWDAEGDNLRVVEPTAVAAPATPYGVTDLEPVTFKAPAVPFVGAVALVLTDENGRRVAANYANLVVKADKPLARVERLRDQEAIFRFEPSDYSKQSWSGPSASPPGKVWGQGEGFVEYRVKVPESVIKAKLKSFALHMEIGSKAGREKVDWPSRSNPEDYPQTDERHWPSTVEVTYNGKLGGRVDLADDAADARGVLSHIARRDHGSHGSPVTFHCGVPEAVAADLAAGKPLVIRVGVPEDAPHAGGLCIFGSDTGQYPCGVSLTIQTERVLADDLGVKPSDVATLDRQADRVSTPLASGDTEKPSTWAYTTTDPGPGWESAGFNANAWPRGESGFGTGDTPAIRVRTNWETPRIWLRTSFELSKLIDGDALNLHAFHDEDVEVFVNGKPLWHAEGYTSSYLDITLDAAQKALFVEGANAFAVSCRQTRGGQGVDVGLRLEKAERPK